MKSHAARCTAVAVALALPFGLGLVDHHAAAIEAKGGSGASAGSAGSSTASTRVAAGVVTAVDAQGGSLVLDGSRRFVFDARTLRVRRQSNAGSPARLIDVGVGSRVSLTVVRTSAGAAEKVSEVWLAP